MLADALLPNLVLFAAGQAAAWFYLRTGRFAAGLSATLALWVLLDWWLVVRYVLVVPADAQLVPLLCLQVAAVAVAGSYAGQRLRRRINLPQRAARFRQALRDHLAGDHAAARGGFRRLVAADPWDSAAWVALGDVLRRGGDLRGARRCYRRGLAVDVERRYADLVRQRTRPRAAPPAAAAPR